MSQMKNYFRSLMHTHENQLLRSILIDMLDCKNRVSRELRTGKIQVNEEQTDLDTIIANQRGNEAESQARSKRLLLQKEIESMKREDYQSDEAFRKAKQEVILQRQEEIRQEKQERERKKKEMEEKVKKWSQQQKELLKKKQAKMTEEQKIREMQMRSIKVNEQKEKQAAALEKRRQIEENLKAIEENRNRREEMMRSLRSQSQDRIPLYVEYQKRAKQLEDQRKFQENIQKKNHKLSMKVDYETLKNHQRLFLTKIQQRNQRFQESRARASSSLPDDKFNIFTNRSEQKIKEQLEKKNRRWKYQQKIKKIPIEIDESKKVKVQIALDRAKNPFKYNFLSQKSLNQFQIFGQFKNFSISTNPRQLGINYLEQLKKKPKQSRIQKSSSMQLIKESAVSDRPQYRNYLAELKSKRPEQKDQQKDEIKKIVSNYKDKDQAYRELEKKTAELDHNVQQKMKELRTLGSQNIRNILKKESQIDEVYAKALKARLACLEIVS